MIAETYVELFKSWPHWAIEYTVEIVTFVLAILPARMFIKRHDAKHHNKWDRCNALEARIAELEKKLQDR